jgi:hypothetical protein
LATGIASAGFAAVSARLGINRFRKSVRRRMLAGCVILATAGPDAPGSPAGDFRKLFQTRRCRTELRFFFHADASAAMLRPCDHAAQAQASSTCTRTTSPAFTRAKAAVVRHLGRSFKAQFEAARAGDALRRGDIWI